MGRRDQEAFLIWLVPDTSEEKDVWEMPPGLEACDSPMGKEVSEERKKKGKGKRKKKKEQCLLSTYYVLGAKLKALPTCDFHNCLVRLRSYSCFTEDENEAGKEKDKLFVLVKVRIRFQSVSKTWALSPMPHYFSFGAYDSIQQIGVNPPRRPRTLGEDETTAKWCDSYKNISIRCRGNLKDLSNEAQSLHRGRDN